MSAYLNKVAGAIWARGNITGAETVALAKSKHAANLKAQETLRDYIRHTGPHVAPALRSAASKAAQLLFKEAHKQFRK